MIIVIQTTGAKTADKGGIKEAKELKEKIDELEQK